MEYERCFVATSEEFVEGMKRSYDGSVVSMEIKSTTTTILRMVKRQYPHGT